jgi:hypothetical protein
MGKPHKQENFGDHDLDDEDDDPIAKEPHDIPRNLDPDDDYDDDWISHVDDFDVPDDVNNW